MILKIKKHRFHQQKSNIWINNIDIYKIVVSDKVSVGKKGFKHFVCKDDKKLYILLPIIRASNRDFDETNMSFLIKNDELSEKYQQLGKMSAILPKKNLKVNLHKTKNI